MGHVPMGRKCTLKSCQGYGRYETLLLYVYYTFTIALLLLVYNLLTFIRQFQDCEDLENAASIIRDDPVTRYYAGK